MPISYSTRHLPVSFLFIVSATVGALFVTPLHAGVSRVDDDEVRRVDDDRPRTAPRGDVIRSRGTVTSVLTPDQFLLDGRTIVRLAGIHGPIADEPKRIGDDYYGADRLRALRELVEGKPVRLEFGTYQKDGYGRVLAYVFLEDGTYVNLRMVELGHALAACTPANPRDCRKFIEAQKAAVAARRGLWSADDNVATAAPAPGARDLIPVKVQGVLDGDTIQLADGTVVRYIGIDAPEEDQLYVSGSIADQAMRYNRVLLENRRVWLEYDLERKDPRGRDLAWVWFEYNGVLRLAQADMVRQGFAWVAVFPPNTRRLNMLLQAQQEAIDAGRGIWKTE